MIDNKINTLIIMNIKLFYGEIAYFACLTLLVNVQFRHSKLTRGERKMAERTLTGDQLSAFDGKDGHPAYVACNGIVYDVSSVPNWKGGHHHGNLAGHDITPAMKRSIHGDSVLKDLPVVGKYIGEPEE